MTRRDDFPNLEYSVEEMRQMGDAVLARAIEHIATLASQPSCGDLDVDDYCRTLREAAPEDGTALEPLLDRLFDDWIPKSFTTAGPGYLGYIPGGGVYPAALADFIQNTTNRFTGIWRGAPALVQLETNALDWIRDWMTFPATTRGLFTVGGSMATFNAILCARERHLGADIRPGTVYTSAQAHHSVAKSAKLAGIMPDRVRQIGVDDQFRMRLDALEAAIDADRRAGLKPFLVVSSAGTTNTGAVDPFDRIADLCADRKLWHHVDGAYGGFFYICPELRPLMRGMDRADSLTLDPHKGLFLPYGTGALLVRDGAVLHAAHAATGEYMPAMPDDCYDPSQHGPDLSRGFPGLRVWLTVKLYGAAKLRAAVAEKRQLAVAAAEAIGRVPGIVIDAPPQLSLFGFHIGWPTATLEEQNAATTELINRVTARGKVMLTGCTTGGRFLARVCVLSFRTRPADIDTCVEHVAEEAARILATKASLSNSG